ncbi:MAG: hypothetical protein ABUU24_02630 [Variovorax sp.]
MKSIIRSGFVCLALASSWMLPAAAQTPVSANGIAQQAGGPAATFAAPVDPSALAAYRGGTQVVTNDMTLAGTTAENTASHVNTGSNMIGSGAFSSMSGIPVVIQNSGANVLIQNALIVHMQMN